MRTPVFGAAPLSSFATGTERSTTAFDRVAMGAGMHVLKTEVRAPRVAARRRGRTKPPAQPPTFRARRQLPRPLALLRLVDETWLDGCLTEGLAARWPAPRRRSRAATRPPCTHPASAALEHCDEAGGDPVGRRAHVVFYFDQPEIDDQPKGAKQRVGRHRTCPDMGSRNMDSRVRKLESEGPTPSSGLGVGSGEPGYAVVKKTAARLYVS